jgi:hypothetical protein
MRSFFAACLSASLAAASSAAESDIGARVAVSAERIGPSTDSTAIIITPSAPLAFGTQVQLRPFAQIGTGDRSLVRVGADLTFGLTGLPNASGAAADPVPTTPEGTGLSLVLGADIAHSWHDAANIGATLPQDAPAERARIGLNWQGSEMGVFYGLTWLGRQTADPDADRLIGSVTLDIRF